MRTEIVYEDNDILVIYKPAGLATQTSRIGQVDVVSELKNYLATSSGVKGAPYIGVVHRLDQPVEGLLVFAKTKQAAANLTAQLQSREQAIGFHKCYYAVVCGAPAKKQGVLENFLYKNQENKAVIVDEEAVSKAKEGKEAVAQTAKRAKLEYCTMGTVTPSTIGENLPQRQISMMDITLHTGRFHQIRAQMAHADMPLLGDQKYGTPVSTKVSAQMDVRNVALHAYRLEFVHPKTKEQKIFEIKPKGQIFGLFF